MRRANEKPKALIVYYSRSGKTRRIAQAIAKASGADLDEIGAARSRDGVLGLLGSLLEGSPAYQSRILPAERDPSGYDVVIVGTPAWRESVSSPVRSYLRAHRVELPEVAFFVTLGGSRAERVLSQMEILAGKRPLARLALSEKYMVEHPAVCIGEFLEALLDGWERRSLPCQPVA